MEIGALTGHLDAAQVVLYVFWAFFAGLLFYLQRETRREGYPLESDVTGKPEDIADLFMPSPKTFNLADGRTVSVPDYKRETRPLNAEAFAPHPGAPIVPTGNPLLAGVGPGSWAERADHPDMTADGQVKIVPLRVAGDYFVADGEDDPRGKKVIGGDGQVGATVSEVWVDRSEVIIRYLEMTVSGADGATKTVLAPWGFCDTAGDVVDIPALYSHQFADVPAIKSPDQITLLEEEKIMAYFGAGELYAEWRRAEPLV